MLALRAFMFERVYLGEHARGEHVKAHQTIAAIFDAPRRAAATSEDEIRAFVSGMTDRFALEYAGRSSGADQGVVGQGGRVGLRHGRGRLRPHGAAEGRRALLGALSLPRGADAELLGQPGRQALSLLRLRQGRRRDHVRPRDREPRLRRGGRVAGRTVPGHARVRGDVAAAGGVAQAARPAPRRARPGRLVLRALPLGVGRGRARPRLPREPRARRGRLPRVPPRPLARHGPRARRRARRASRPTSCAPRVSQTRAATTTSRSG